MKDLKKNIRAFALLNAAKYGKASAKAVLGQIFRKFPELNKNPHEIYQLIEEIIKIVNKLSLKSLNAEINKLPSEFREIRKPKAKKELPPLSKTNQLIIMRLAPFPSGPLHIGNARMVILNDYYVKRYKGKLLLVYDDTIGSKEKRIIPEAYEMIDESLTWLGVKYQKKLYKSDRIDKTYDWCREAIEKNFAYICKCPSQEWREKYKVKKRPCPHRNQSKDTSLEEWDKMLDGVYEEGEAVARLKVGMDNLNPAVRDPVIMRIVKRPHPRIGTKYIVWPLLEFSWAIDDHLLGITHILRGKDLIKEDYIEKWVWEKFGWPLIEFIHYGLIKFKGLTLSKTQSRLNIESGIYRGWDDPRTWSLYSLMKRGIKPSVLKEAIISLGLKMVDIEYSPQDLYARNKKVIDPIASRYFYIPNPVKLFIQNIPYPELISHPFVHPDHRERGTRTISLPISQRIAEVYIWEYDVNFLKTGSIIRLKDLCNIRIIKKSDTIEAQFLSKALEDAPDKRISKIQWVPCKNNVKIQILMDNGTLLEGFGEPECQNLKLNQIIQFERVGFGKVSQIKPIILVYFAHKSKWTD
ncbi:MAG: glutamate--tRNA ligase [Promethearchaeota archaeon]